VPAVRYIKTAGYFRVKKRKRLWNINNWCKKNWGTGMQFDRHINFSLYSYAWEAQRVRGLHTWWNYILFCSNSLFETRCKQNNLFPLIKRHPRPTYFKPARTLSSLNSLKLWTSYKANLLHSCKFRLLWRVVNSSSARQLNRIGNFLFIKPSSQCKSRFLSGWTILYFFSFHCLSIPKQSVFIIIICLI